MQGHPHLFRSYSINQEKKFIISVTSEDVKKGYLEHLAKQEDGCNLDLPAAIFPPNCTPRFRWKQWSFDYPELRLLCQFMSSSHRGNMSMVAEHWKYACSTPEQVSNTIHNVCDSLIEQLMNPPAPPWAKRAVDRTIKFPYIDNLTPPGTMYDQQNLYEKTSLVFCPSKLSMPSNRTMGSRSAIQQPHQSLSHNFEDYKCTIKGLSLPPLFTYLFMNLAVFNDGSPCIFNQQIEVDGLETPCRSRMIKVNENRDSWYKQGGEVKSVETPLVSLYPYCVDSTDDTCNTTRCTPIYCASIFHKEEVIAGLPYGKRLTASRSVDELYKFFIVEPFVETCIYRLSNPNKIGNGAPGIDKQGSQEHEVWKLAVLLQAVGNKFNQFRNIGDWLDFYDFMHVRAGSNLPYFTATESIADSLFDVIHQSAMLLQSLTDIRFTYVGGLEATVGRVLALANLRVPIHESEPAREDLTFFAAQIPLSDPNSWSAPYVDFNEMNKRGPVELVWAMEEREEGDTAMGVEECQLLHHHSKSLSSLSHSTRGSVLPSVLPQSKKQKCSSMG